MRQTFVAVHALIKRGNRFLVTKRSNVNNYMPGVWDIPGGTIEFGENILQALEREIKEEVNLQVDVEKIVFCYGYLSGTSRHQFQLVYLCKYKLGTVELNLAEHSDFRWVDLPAMSHLKKIAFLGALYQEIKK